MITDTGPSFAKRISQDVGVASEVFAVRNAPLEALLFDRNVVGSGYADLCAEAATHMVSHLREELLRCDPAELVILSKGLAYQLTRAASSALGTVLPVNLLATQRREVSSAEDIGIDVTYSRIDTLADTLIIGDTIASGATLVSALEAYTGRTSLRRLYLLSFCGSGVGVRRIGRWCEAHGIQLTVLLGLAAFGLAENGFDLSFLHPETVADPEDVARASRQFDGQPVSAVGWDFGSQWMAPGKYGELCWMEADYWGLLGHPALSAAKRLEPSSISTAERSTYPSRR